MEQYISKSTLVAEIDRLENKLYYEPEKFKDVGAKMALDSLKSFLDTIEVNSKDAFIEKATLWLFTNASDYVVLHNSYDTKELVKDFVNAMKRD